MKICLIKVWHDNINSTPYLIAFQQMSEWWILDNDVIKMNLSHHSLSSQLAQVDILAQGAAVAEHA